MLIYKKTLANHIYHIDITAMLR